LKSLRASKNSHQNYEYVISRKSWREWLEHIAKSNHAVKATLVYFTGQSRNLTLTVCSHFTGWSHLSEYYNYSLCSELSPLLCTLTSLWKESLNSDGHQYQQQRKFQQRWSTIPPISTKVRCYIINMQVRNIIPSSYFEKHTSYIAKHKTSNMYQQ
jgi:hypothetical protein